jgi:hypothetical protein
VTEPEDQGSEVLRALGDKTGAKIEVVLSRHATAEIENSQRKIVSLKRGYSSILAIRMQIDDNELFASLSPSGSPEDVKKAMTRAASAKVCAPLPAAADAYGHRSRPKSLDVSSALEERVRSLTSPAQRLEEYDGCEMRVDLHSSYIVNSLGISTWIAEESVVVQHPVQPAGLDGGGVLCYPTTYSSPKKLMSNKTCVRHRGQFRARRKRCEDILVIQGDVMVQVLAAWAQEATPKSIGRARLESGTIDISEAAPMFRSRGVDDAGRKVRRRWHVRGGIACDVPFRPQGEYRSEADVRPQMRWNCLMLHPSRRPLTEVLEAVGPSFYVSQLFGLVLGQDGNDKKSLHVKLGGFDLADGKLVGEFRWIDRAIPWPSFFDRIDAVGDDCFHGRWKWATGWFASPTTILNCSGRDLIG